MSLPTVYNALAQLQQAQREHGAAGALLAEISSGFACAVLNRAAPHQGSDFRPFTNNTTNLGHFTLAAGELDAARVEAAFARLRAKLQEVQDDYRALLDDTAAQLAGVVDRWRTP